MTKIKEDLEKLGFKTLRDTGHVLRAKLPYKVKVYEDGIFCEAHIVLTYRKQTEVYDVPTLFLRKYMSNNPHKDYTPEELEFFKKYTLYDGVCRDLKHLRTILFDTIYYNY